MGRKFVCVCPYVETWESFIGMDQGCVLFNLESIVKCRVGKPVVIFHVEELTSVVVVAALQKRSAMVCTAQEDFPPLQMLFDDCCSLESSNVGGKASYVATSMQKCYGKGKDIE